MAVNSTDLQVESADLLDKSPHTAILHDAQGQDSCLTA